MCTSLLDSNSLYNKQKDNISTCRCVGNLISGKRVNNYNQGQQLALQLIHMIQQQKIEEQSRQQQQKDDQLQTQ